MPKGTTSQSISCSENQAYAAACNRPTARPNPISATTAPTPVIQTPIPIDTSEPTNTAAASFAWRSTKARNMTTAARIAAADPTSGAQSAKRSSLFSATAAITIVTPATSVILPSVCSIPRAEARASAPNGPLGPTTTVTQARNVATTTVTPPRVPTIRDGLTRTRSPDGSGSGRSARSWIRRGPARERRPRSVPGLWQQPTPCPVRLPIGRTSSHPRLCPV